MSAFTRRHLGKLALAGGLAAIARGAAAQQAWPTRPVTLIVPFPAGGATDVVARAIGRSFSETFGQSFVVENRSGAGGNIGVNLVAKAPPDGQTLTITTNGPITNNTLMYRSMSYDPLTDLAPVAPVAELPCIIVARPQMPFNDIQGLVAYAKANPGKLNCGVPGTGVLGHLASELLQHRTGIQYAQIPYRGSAPLTNDVLAGAVDIAFDLVTTYLPHLQAGTLKALGITSQQKLPQLPDLRPIAAQGVEGFQATGWIALLGPARLPATVVQRLHGAIAAWLAGDASQRLMEQLALSPLTGTPDELAGKMRAEIALWRPIVQSIGLTAE